MTNLPRFALSADIGSVHYFTAPILNHEPPEAFEGFTWFVVVCNPKCERRAQLGLRRAGYQTYLPVERKYVERSRRLVETENPLLPRYLFIGVRAYGQEGGQDLYKIRGVDGVEKVVRFDGEPLRVHYKRLEFLRGRERDGEFDHIKRAEEEKARKKALRAKCRPGAHVSLLNGAMTGLHAIVQKVQSGGRIEVLIEFLGGVTRAKLKLDEVELLEAAE
ncbi:transcription termination/antitermination NusG family protein [Vibrio parahaemolyticus]|nr:transcription termination/antitermination NusG family protein [Vibrio parahaemolyticus]